VGGGGGEGGRGGGVGEGGWHMTVTWGPDFMNGGEFKLLGEVGADESDSSSPPPLPPSVGHTL